MQVRITAFVLLGALIGAPCKGADDGIRPAYQAGYSRVPSVECLPDFQRAIIRTRLKQREGQLIALGLIIPEAQAAHPRFGPILRQSSFSRDAGCCITGTYLDENAAAGAVEDYNCGARTYDGHLGTDTGGTPFNWAKFTMNGVQVIAGAPGIILDKEDGVFDRSCGAGPGWNAVYIRHSDGSQAWYGHLKNGSLTKKAIGQKVVKGEYLGVMGSSGNSSGPHVHLEVYDSEGRLVDPYFGKCNDLNPDTWWAKQPRYRDSAINLLLLCTTWPADNPCPIIESTNALDTPRPGQLVYFLVYFRDTAAPQKASFSIIRPDGRTEYKWTSTVDVSWDVLCQGWTWYIPKDGPLGTWKFQAGYAGRTYSHTFDVVSKPAPLRLVKLVPSAVKAGTTTAIQIKGEAFVPGMGVAISRDLKKDDPAIRVTSVKYKSKTLIVATVEVGLNASPTGHLVAVVRPDYVQAFKVNALRITK